MALKSITTPFTPNELAKDINDNITELDSAKADKTSLSDYILLSQKAAASGVASLDSSSEVVQNAKTATTAKNYDTTSGGIKTKFDSLDSEVTNITNGNTVIGKATTLAPTTAPGNNKVFGTSSAGTIGWFDMPTPDEPAPGVSTEPFTSSDSRWGAAVSGIFTLTVPHGGLYPIGVFQQDGALHAQVSVDIQRDTTNILVRAMNKFGGYILVG